MSTNRTSRNEKFIAAAPQKVYDAFTNPRALETWMAPGDMTGKVHHFDLRVGGSYEMSLYYPESEKYMAGKSKKNEDRYTSVFVELDPPRKIVTSTNFVSDKAEFSGELIMEVTLQAQNGGTRVIMVFKNIPPGIKPEDNEEGTRSSLEKLARYLEFLKRKNLFT